MALVKNLKSGFHNSTQAIGEWSVPQEETDDRPRGNRTYDSWEFTKGFSFNGITKDLQGFNLVNDGVEIYISKGKAIMFGHLIELEEDLPVGTAQQIILGVNRNPDTRATYIDLSDTIRESIQEVLGQDEGIYEFVCWELKQPEMEWRYLLPISKTIRDYMHTFTFISGGKNIYDIEISSVSDNFITNPSEYNLENVSLTIYVPELQPINGNKNTLRLRKGTAFIEADFDEDSLKLGKNTIYIYKDSETQIITLTTGRAK